MDEEKLLKAALQAFNEIPNKKLSGVEGYKDTYAIAAAIGQLLNVEFNTQVFIAEYNRNPSSFALLNEEGRTVCSIKQRPTAQEFLMVLKDALKQEMQQEEFTRIQFGEYDHRNYCVDIEVFWIEDVEEQSEIWKLESASVY